MSADPIWTYPAQGNASGSGKPGTFSSDPGATVGWLWEEPADIAQGHIVLRLILGNPNASAAPWAGANVYLSYDDVSYGLFGSTSQRSIIGELSAALAAGAGTWQPAATCDVDITVSPGTLITTDAASCQAGVNLCLIGDEVCSFVDATLIGADEYRLTGFQRGWFGTAVVLHNIGERFAMLSSLQARVDLPITAKGQTWHYKLASFNIGRVEMAMGAAVPLALDGKGLGSTLNNDGLHLRDTDESHELIVTPGSNLTADRILTLTTGDAARTLTFEANAIVSQDYSTDSATVQFAVLTLTDRLAVTQVGSPADTDLLGLGPGQFDVMGFIYARGPVGIAAAGEQIRFGRSDSVVRPHSIYTSHSDVDASNWLEVRIHDKGGTPYQGQVPMLRLTAVGMTLYGAFYAASLKSGATQVAAGAAAGELWVDTDDDTVKRGT